MFLFLRNRLRIMAKYPARHCSPDGRTDAPNKTYLVILVLYSYHDWSLAPSAPSWRVALAELPHCVKAQRSAPLAVPAY